MSYEFDGPDLCNIIRNKLKLEIFPENLNISIKLKCNSDAIYFDIEDQETLIGQLDFIERVSIIINAENICTDHELGYQISYMNREANPIYHGDNAFF